MARPVNANADETRGRILQAALELFARHGYEGASVRQIAAAAGVSLGMIRHYYGSKDGLYDACLDGAYAIYGELGAKVRDSVGAGGDPAETLADAVREGFRHARRHVWACRLLLWDMMHRERWRHERNDEHMVPFILEVAPPLAGPLNRPVGDIALVPRSVVFLVVRYATADADELALLLADGDPRAVGDERTFEQVEEHLARLALTLYR